MGSIYSVNMRTISCVGNSGPTPDSRRSSLQADCDSTEGWTALSTCFRVRLRTSALSECYSTCAAAVSCNGIEMRKAERHRPGRAQLPARILPW